MLLVKRLIGLLLAAVVACGPSPEARDARPSGELVVVIRQGPERVPFRPDVARIKAANEQLSELLGHSIAIEVDGSILPQTHEGAQQVIADLVEAVTRDIDELVTERDRYHRPETHAYARQHFQRLVVRYDPSEASRRRRSEARFDPATGTVDVVLAEATPRAIIPGSVAKVFLDAVLVASREHYARTLPAQLPPAEHRAWLAYHSHELPRGEVVHKLDVIGVRGTLWLLASSSDREIARDARAWLLGRGVADLERGYTEDLSAIEASPPGSPFVVAERELVEWLNDEQAGMTLEERGKLAVHLWVPDWRQKNDARGPKLAERAFPGFDKVSFAFTTIDLWIAAGHPSEPETLRAFGEPVEMDWKDGHVHFGQGISPGRAIRGGPEFYRWLFADAQRTEVLTRAVRGRADDRFTATVFLQAKHNLDLVGYLRFLRGFERMPEHWKIGAYVIQQDTSQATVEILEEARRLWRDLPHARGYALFWLGLHAHANHTYDVEAALAGHVADDSDYASFLDIGLPAVEVLPEIWSGLPKQNRVRSTLGRIDAVIDRDPSLTSRVMIVLEKVAGLLCQDGGANEIAELHAFAIAERARRPGAGFAALVDQTDCKPSHPRAQTQTKPRRDTRSPVLFDLRKK